MSPQNGSQVWGCGDVHLSILSKEEAGKLVSSETKENCERRLKMLRGISYAPYLIYLPSDLTSIVPWEFASPNSNQCQICRKSWFRRRLTAKHLRCTWNDAWEVWTKPQNKSLVITLKTTNAVSWTTASGRFRKGCFLALLTNLQ